MGFVGSGLDVEAVIFFGEDEDFVGIFLEGVVNSFEIVRIPSVVAVEIGDVFALGFF